MNKLIGVMILAAFPVACGSLPSGPDALATNPSAAADNAMASSLAGGRRPAPLPTPKPCEPSDVRIDAITVTVTLQGVGVAALRAEPVIDSTDRVSPCIVPTWGVQSDSSATLSVGKDPQIATLTAPAGRYVVSATVKGPEGPITGSAVVAVR